jgi:outer membrane protein
MKRLSLFALFLTPGFAAIAAAQAPAASAAPKPAAPAAATAPSATKVAVIEFQAAVAQTNEFQRDLADLQKKYDPRRAHLKSLNDEIETLTKQLQDQGAQMSDADRATKARSLDEKKKQLDRESQDAQSDFQNDMQQYINTVAQKVGALMTDYAQKHGYTLVLDAGEEQNATVLYAIESTNITKAVIDAYNAKSGIPAPAAQGASAPAVDAPQPQPAH